MSEKINEKYLQYSSSQVNYNDIKTAQAQDDLSAVKSVSQTDLKAQEDYEKFKTRLKIFSGVDSITKAKELAKGFLPIENEKNYLKIGNARCVIISRGDVFRICLDSEYEYICYNIIKNK